MKYVLSMVVFAVFGSLLFAIPAGAVGLKVAPLEYRTKLAQSESKKGFIDISNPGTDTLRVKTSVQGFRQIDDTGSLRFFEDEQLTAGIRLDLTEFELGPREALRMYFLLDGTKLPSGDVFGGIFFTTEPVLPKNGSGQAVRLGTLLSIVNGTPGSRNAQITSLTVPSFQIDGDIKGTFTIKNTSDPSTSTGFYPTVKVSSFPFGESKDIQSKLVFAGRSRENSFELNTLPFGIYRIEADFQGSSQSRWVIVAHPISVLAMVFIVVLLGLIYRLVRRRRKNMSHNVSGQ